jgi:uncharacterized protein (UPF0276 family)
VWLQTLVANFEHLKKQLPVLGIGLGYRSAVFEQTLEQANRIDWLEIISEQYMNAGGKVLNLLEQATSVFSVIPHGVSLSIGSTDQLNVSYLKSLKRLIDKLDPPWWSDHLSFSSHGGVHMNELLPLPFTRETARYVAQRARVLQELMERPFLLENITYYMKLPGSEMTEAQFISEVLELSDCGLLLDINNVYVNSINHGFDPHEFLRQIPLERTVQIHVAGHIHAPKFKVVLDTHGEAVSKPVFDLLSHVVGATDVKAILLERDQHFPDDFNEILNELDQIRSIAGCNLSPQPKSLQKLFTGADTNSIVVLDSNKTARLNVDAPQSLCETEQAMQKLWMSRDAADRFLHGDETQVSSVLGREVDHLRLPIYVEIVNNSYLNLMTDFFPLCALVLRPQWKSLVSDFISHYPLRTYEITNIGVEFPEFLAQHVFERYKRSFPFLVELAKYESIESRVIDDCSVVQIGERCDLQLPDEFSTYGPIINPVLVLERFEYPLIEIARRLELSKRLPRNVQKSKSTVIIYRDPLSLECRYADIGKLAAAIIEKTMSTPFCSYAELASFAISLYPYDAPEKVAGEFLELVSTLYSSHIFVGDQKLQSIECFLEKQHTEAL